MNKLKNLLFLGIILSSLNAYAQWEPIHKLTLPENWGVAWAIDACNDSTVVLSVNYSSSPDPLMLTTDAGNNWRALNWPLIGNYSNVVDVSITDENHIWGAVDDGRIIATTDGGINWTLQFQDTNKTKFMNYIEMFDERNGAAMGDSKASNLPAVILSTTDGGSHWNELSSTPNGSSGDIWRRIDFINMNCGYFYNSGGEQFLYKTLDGGIGWTRLDRPLSLDVLKFYNEKIGVAYGNDQNKGKSATVTTDGGVTWGTTEFAVKGWGNDIEFLPGNPVFVWLTNGSGLYYSTDTAGTWHLYQTGYSGSLRDIVFTDSVNGWLLGDNGQVYHTANNGGVITAVENKNEIPSGFSLSQNYPNPFNPSTTIRFVVPAVGNAKFAFPTNVKVYDVLGREVATLVNGEKSPGTYEIKFDASDLPSGIYVYRMTAGSFSESRKMILIK